MKHVDLITPAVALKGTTASAIFDGLFKSAESAQQRVFAHRVLDMATARFIVVECDGAYSNDKCIWHFFASLKDLSNCV